MQHFKTKAFRTLFLMSTAATLAFAAPATQADDLGISLSANATIVSDYRFRGVTLSDKDVAFQGGFDVSTESGFYVGTWGSSIESYEGSELELDIYAGYATSFSELDFDIGILGYTYPGSTGPTTYWEAYSSLGGSAGSVGWTVGAAYAFSQESIGDDDNIYLYADLSYPIAETALSLTAHVGYEDGAFGDEKVDWTLGASYDFKQFSLGVSYIDTNINSSGSNGGVVVSLGASF
ncbi:MAG: hypothetical protein JKY34_07665 [Kordiimonadaceae bacterium]|nr:hypothetical protein [Kordiimonadaceae bacterium]